MERLYEFDPTPPHPAVPDFVQSGQPGHASDVGLVHQLKKAFGFGQSPTHGHARENPIIALQPSAEHVAEASAEQVNAAASNVTHPTESSFGERVCASKGVVTADSFKPAAVADTVLSGHLISIKQTAEAATKSLREAAEVLEVTRKVPQPTADPVAELAQGTLAAPKGLEGKGGSGFTKDMDLSTGEETKGMGGNGEGAGKAVHRLVSHAIQNAVENADGTAQTLHDAGECDDAKQPVTETDVDITRAEDINAEEGRAGQGEEGTAGGIAPKTWSEVVMGSVAAVSQVAQQTVGLAVEKVSGSRGNGGTPAARNGDSLNADG